MGTSDELDPEWQATLLRFRMRGIEQRRAERKDPKLREQRLAAESRRIADSVRSELTRMGVPKKLIDELLQVKARETEAMTWVREWDQRRKTERELWALELSGDTGLGKDFAIARWFFLQAKERAKRGHTMFAIAECWFSAPVLMPKAITRYGTFDATVLDACSTMPFLVLEDLGAEAADKAGKWLSWLFAVLNERHKHSRVTFITTNLDADDFDKRYGSTKGKRIMSRLAAGGIFAEVAGPNMRRKGAGDHLPIAGAKQTEQLELGQRRTVRTRSAPYIARILSPRAQAKRRQLELRFA